MQVLRRPPNVSFRRGSKAEQIFRERTGAPQTEALAAGLGPTPAHDLHFHGGKIIPALHFMNFFIGADAWVASDISNINENLAAAMSDIGLNNVMEQYFPGSITSTFDGSESLAGPAPVTFSQGDVEALVASLEAQGVR